jgi:hypothetical protein
LRYLFGILSCLFWIVFQGFHIFIYFLFHTLVFLISSICLYYLWAHLIVYSHPLWYQILTFIFLLWGH